MSKTYSVCIDYKKGASFSIEIESVNQAQAETDAKTFATGCGFTDAVRKITTREVQA